MPKYRSSAITGDEILQYVEQVSDFSFELETLYLLRSLDVECRHGGLYTDPVSGKSRQFDIRALRQQRKGERGQMSIEMAVECKNLRASFPLVVQTVPREPSEALVDVIVGHGTIGPHYDPGKVIRIRSRLHGVDKAVGKAMAQVGVNLSGEVEGSDAEVFDKWSQSVSSAQELMVTAQAHHETMTIVLPILVVPNGSLWSVHYGADGERMTTPLQRDHVSYYVGKSTSALSGGEMRLMHMEIMTLTGLRSFCERYLASSVGMQDLFPKHLPMRSAFDELKP